MSRTITQSGTIGKHDIIQQTLAVGLFNTVHFVTQISKLLHVEIIDFNQVIEKLALIMGHLMMTLWLIK